MLMRRCKSQSWDAAGGGSSTPPFMRMMRAQFGPRHLLCTAAKNSQKPGKATPASGVKVGSVWSVVNRFLVAKETISLVAACLPHLTKLVSISSKEQRGVASQETKPQIG